VKIARIVAPYCLSALMFILTYLAVQISDSGFYPLILLILGIIFAIVGIYFSLSDK